MELTQENFRLVMGHFVTGVSVVTTWERVGETPDRQRAAGITVNSLSSVSLAPPLVVVALDRRRFITPMVHEARRFAVSILGVEQQGLSDCFAHAPVRPGREDFCGAAWHAGATGLPLIDGAIAHLECTVIQAFPVGDHDLFVGRVDAIGAAGHAGLGVAEAEPGEHDDPLIYYRRRYLRVERARSTRVEGKPEG